MTTTSLNCLDWDNSVMLMSFSLPTLISFEINPTEETWSTAPGPSTEIEYLPSASVVAAFCVPLTRMLTPANGMLFSSVTTPFSGRGPWKALAAMEQNKNDNKKNLEIDFMM